MSMAFRWVAVLDPSISQTTLLAQLGPWADGPAYEEHPERTVWPAPALDDVEALEVSRPARGFRVWESESWLLPYTSCDCGCALVSEQDDEITVVLATCPRCDVGLTEDQIICEGRGLTDVQFEPRGPGIAHRLAVILHGVLPADPAGVAALLQERLAPLGVQRIVLDAG